jgi:hypothetical protein
VWNRAASRFELFNQDEDDAAFIRILIEAHQRIRSRSWTDAQCPNHWCFVVYPAADDR